MFSHVMIGTNDLDRAKTFYDKLLGTLGVPPAVVDRHRIFYRTKTGTFAVSKPIDGEPATHANGGTTCEDPPGVRDNGAVKLYLAYLRDPDGNKICVLHRVP
jgi:catechol 2,3-dioxygenase-like lactoylglutathione lyase family enzyme